jgi:glucose uptake protein
MYIVSSYTIAVIFCFITMLCWGSWANTSKCTNEKWPFTLFYWDYSLGLILAALIYGITMGSTGSSGRSFLEDVAQADVNSILFALLGGAIFNLSNLLVIAAITIAGFSVAYPITGGLALVLGVIIVYIKVPTGNPLLLFLGVGLIVTAIIVNAIGSAKMSAKKGDTSKKGIVIAILSGIIMSFFYRFVSDSMSTDFITPKPGKLTPYSAILVFSVGLFISNFVWNSFFMYRPLTGRPVSYKQYFVNGTLIQHAIGILGGIIFNTGFLFSLVASDKAGPAISYGLGQGATMIGAAWGIFVHKEFKGAPATVNRLLIIMFMTFIIGLTFIILARIN